MEWRNHLHPSIFQYVSSLLSTLEYRAEFNLEDVFDGAMVVLAIYIMNFAHPGFLRGSEQAVISSEDPSDSLELGTEETVMAERT